MRGIATTIVWLGLVVLVWAKPPALKFKYFSKSDGLSSTNMTDIVQDSVGFIWLGTNNGVNRFNGKDFSYYNNSHEDSVHYSMRIINDLFIDPQGRLWCASLNTVSKYNSSLDIFEFVKADIYPEDIDHSPIIQIEETSEGKIYMITENSISEYDESQNTFKHIKSFSQHLTCTQPGPNGEIWIGTSKSPFLYKGDISGDFQVQALKVHHPISDLLLHQDKLLIGTLGDGLYSLNTSNNTLLKYTNTTPNSNYISSVFVDNYNQVWVCDHTGLHFFDSNTKSFYGYYPSASKYSINSSVNQFFQDNEGNYWSLHNHSSVGLSMYSNKINTYNKEIEENWYPSLSNTTTIHEDKNGNLWIGSFNGGIDIFYWLENRVKRIYPGSCGLPLGSISMIHQNENNQMVVSVYDKGLYTYNSSTEIFTPNNTQLPVNDNPLHILSRLKASDGSIWFANHGNGIFQWKDNHFKVFTDKNSKLSNNWVHQVIEDQKKNIWVASAWGISKLKANADTFKTYFTDPQLPNSIPDNEILCILEDSHENIWFGTGRGLAKYSYTTDDFETFLYGKEIKSIIEWEPGVLWLSVSSDIVKFNTSNGTLKFFGPDEGNEISDFIPRSSYKSSQEIFFGGSNGLAIFSPEQLKTNNITPTVVFTHLKVLNKEINFKTNPEVIDKNITELPSVNLQYDQNVFTIGFKALSYNAANKCQYKYKLEGFEKEWISTTGNIPEVTYTNLKPGNYTFRVIASNNDGIWNKDESILQIKVYPPWYLRKSFKFFSTILIIITVWLLIIMRTKRLSKTKVVLENEVMHTTKALIKSNHNLKEQAKHLTKLNYELKEQQETIKEQTTELKIQSDKLHQANAELTKINNAKDRLFSVIAHDLQSPFNSILGLSELFYHSYDELSDEDKIHYAKTINTSSTKVYNLLQNLLLWFKSQTRNIELAYTNFKLIDIIKDTLDLLKAVAENKDISIDVQVDKNVKVTGDIDMITTVFRNLISNAIKFSHKSGKVSVISKQHQDKILISIKDEGQGMTPEVSANLFHKDNMYTSSGTDGEKGHGLGLVICKEFIDLHKNQLYIESELGKGSTFYFTIDLAQE